MCDIGLIGLAVMGQNLALNIAEKGFSVAVFNRTLQKVHETVERAQKEETPDKKLRLKGCFSFEELVDSLNKPRKIIILVKSGDPVDAILNQITPLLSEGDVIVDGGNEWYKITEQRMDKLLAKKILFIGMGISGGEEGARIGASLMPGGPPEAYKLVEPILSKIAAIVDGQPCVSYMGKSGSGNYVKMVHNGIEYGDMELIAEVYSLLRFGLSLSPPQIAKIFEKWNEGELKSFLIEITAEILMKKDDKTDNYLVDQILDVAGSKGTGMWTVEEATRRGVPCPTIEAALSMRYLSALNVKKHPNIKHFSDESFISKKKIDIDTDVIKDALICSKISSYAQGLMLLQIVSVQENWNLDIAEIARGWCGGCIIRADLLNDIRKAYLKNPKLECLLLDSYFANILKSKLSNWRKTVISAIQVGIPVPGLAASLTFFDSLVAEKLPVNLLQAQRDFFGAHTYKRIDDDGETEHHTNWKN